MEYLRNNFRPLQSLDNREVFKSAVKDAWLPDLTDSLGNPYGTDASKGGRALLPADWLAASIKPDVCTLWLWITYPVFISSRIFLDTNLDSNRVRFPSLVLTQNASHNVRANACVSVCECVCVMRVSRWHMVPSSAIVSLDALSLLAYFLAHFSAPCGCCARRKCTGLQLFKDMLFFSPLSIRYRSAGVQKTPRDFQKQFFWPQTVVCIICILHEPNNYTLFCFSLLRARYIKQR